jgi:hypothetical protein
VVKEKLEGKMILSMDKESLGSSIPTKGRRLVEGSVSARPRD